MKMLNNDSANQSQNVASGIDKSADSFSNNGVAVLIQSMYNENNKLSSTFFTCEDVANYYGVTVNTVWRWCRTKKMSSLKIGKRYLIRPSDLIKFEQAQEQQMQ